MTSKGPPPKTRLACVHCRKRHVRCEVKISPDGDDISCIRCIRKRLQCEYIGVEEQESREWSQGSAVPVSRYPNGQSHSGRYGSSHPYYPPDAQHPAGPSKIGHGGGGAPYSQMYSTMGPSEGFHPQHAQYAQPGPSQRWAYGEQSSLEYQSGYYLQVQSAPGW
ncbi:hypothetical protein C8F01DRAFT_1233418 [Mycena amicta]|nr:hypothetical protein C8F01DRAFT_1233418 [Mycena amicta]